MAISNIFGSNTVDTTLLFVADVAYQGQPVLSTIDRQAMFLAGVGIVVSVIYLIGLIERRNKSFLRAGLDSQVVLAVYFGSVIALYFFS